MVTYNRLELLKQSLSALRCQTYQNTEIIVANNGSTDGTTEYLAKVMHEDKRVRTVHFNENQYSPQDPNMPMAICTTAALELATGDYIWYQNDDDMVANDYVEKMVALFEENLDCTSAAGLPVSIDINGNILEQNPRSSNYRPRYMPGHLLALNVSRSAGVMFNAPGAVFAFKRDFFIQSGGFHREIEASHLYGIVPFGVTGFDETAQLYWRRHPEQTNIIVTNSGWVGFVDYRNQLIEEWNIEERWKPFGSQVASDLVRDLKNQAYRNAVNWLVSHLLSGNIYQAGGIFMKLSRHRKFWPAVVFTCLQKSAWLAPLKVIRRIWSQRD